MALEGQDDTYMKHIMEKLLLLIPLNEPRPFPWAHRNPFYSFELTFTTNQSLNEYTITLEGKVGVDQNYESGTIDVLDVYEINRDIYIYEDVAHITQEQYVQIMGYLEDSVYEGHKIEAEENAYYDHNRGLNQNNETNQNEQTIPNRGDQRVPTRGGDWHGRNQNYDNHNVPSITCTAEGYLFKTVALS